MSPEIYIDLLNRALTEEMGLAVTTNNPKQLSHHLIAAAKTDARFSELIVSIPSTPEMVFIAKKTVELNEDVF